MEPQNYLKAQELAAHPDFYIFGGSSKKMHSRFLPYFCDPVDKATLTYVDFASEGNNLKSGIFVNPKSGRCYPLMNGVPVFLQDSFSNDFMHKYNADIKKVKESFPNAVINASQLNDWSFSSEWEAHKDEEMDTTWGMTQEGRYEQFHLELETTEAEVKGMHVLDAGCGNGILTELLSTKGMITFGIDYSNSVFNAETKRKSDGVCFLRGDLQQPPFADGTFDIIVSNGVLHHTPNTRTTFLNLSKTVKLNGRFFIWLYERKGSFFWGVKRRIFDWLRMIICRLPAALQKFIVSIFTGTIFFFYKLAGKKLDYATLRVDMFDSLTPRWRYYHTPEEVSEWYFEAGFGAVRLTHWDNRYGFGVYAFKTPVVKPPGERYVVK